MSVREPVLSECSEGSSTIHSLRPQLTLSCLGLDFPRDQGDPGPFFLFSTCLSERSYLHRYAGGRKRRKLLLEYDGKGGS